MCHVERYYSRCISCIRGRRQYCLVRMGTCVIPTTGITTTPAIFSIVAITTQKGLIQLFCPCDDSDRCFGNNLGIDGLVVLTGVDIPIITIAIVECVWFMPLLLLLLLLTIG